MGKGVSRKGAKNFTQRSKGEKEAKSEQYCFASFVFFLASLRETENAVHAKEQRI
jgi:hypothetical protein